MIKLILFTMLLNVEDIQYVLPAEVKTEASRKRKKGIRGRNRGGNGLR